MRASPLPSRPYRLSPLLPLYLSVLLATSAQATTQILLSRGEKPEGEFKGVVELTIRPGFDDARVTLIVDGQKLADGMRSPYRVTVDFGPLVVEHKISVTAFASGDHRVQWHETVNHGHLPLGIKLQPVDLANRVFEAAVTAPDEDPVRVVELWEGGKVIASSSEPPYRFTIPIENFLQQFVQVTAKSRSGEEAADFWSGAGDVH